MVQSQQTRSLREQDPFFTPQQQILMEHIVNGRNVTQAADEMHIGRETAKHHMVQIRKKLKARTIPQAAAIAAALNLVYLEIG